MLRKFFSTVAVEQGFAAHASIAMAKGAIVGLTRTLATEYAPKIRVNAIAPSLVDTPLGQTVAGNPKMAEAVAKMHAIPRLGRPDDIAAMGELLLTEAGSWITGQVAIPKPSLVGVVLADPNQCCSLA